MNAFNLYGLVLMAAMMAPNIIFAVKCKDGFENLWRNKAVEALEQIGRFGCFGLMIVNLPHTFFGFWFSGGPVVYIAVNAVLMTVYCAVWAVCFHRNSVSRALTLSILPSAIFLFSGVMILSVPLILAALIFAPCHILLSCQNARLAAEKTNAENSAGKASDAALAGYRKKSFAMPFGGGEIWFEHLDGMKDAAGLAVQKLAEDWLTLKRPSSPSLCAVNLDDIKISSALFSELTDKLLYGEKRLLRVVFVGVSRTDAKRLKKALCGATFAFGFENDFERAKEWLVCEQRGVE